MPAATPAPSGSEEAMSGEGVSPSATNTLEQARAHARSQSGRVASRVTVPSSTARRLPDGVAPADVIWDETVGAGRYIERRLPRGSVLRVEDLTGDSCLNLQVLNARQPSERLNPADTVKVQWQAYLGDGATLLSDLGRVLMTLVEDSSGRHDALCGHSNRRGNEARYGHGGVHGASPNARDLLALAAARHDLGRRDLTAGINLFAAVRVADDGSLRLAPPGGPGHVHLRAEVDVVVLGACAPHPLDDRARYAAGDVRLTAWRTTRRDPDPYRTTSPERERAFLNTDEYLSGVAR
jgi:urea carboxylase-associated protein 2